MTRLGIGIVRMAGERHAHYRRLLVPPLRRANVEALGGDMVRLAEEEVGTWPVGQRVDLWALARRLMRTFAIGLLFGDDREHGYRVAEGIGRLCSFNWSLRVGACPVDLPFTPYGRMLRVGEALEREILAWADAKRGALDGRDLLSIVVNNPDEKGNAPSDALIAGHVPTLFGAAYETCQNALIWTLVLLAQHPKVARDLLDELRGSLAGSPISLGRIAELPLLDSAVKESMRLLPPVPVQMRVAVHPTSLAGYPLAAQTRVVLSPFLTNRLPDLYPEADRFRPERWSALDPSSFEYSAFSAGPRACPGYWFGSGVVKMALAAILLRHRVALAPDARIGYQVKVTLMPGGPVPAVLHRPDGAFAAAPIRGSIARLVRFPA